MGRQQVAALRAKQKVEMEAKAREVVAIKLQAAWRGRQGRMRVSVTCPRLDGCHTGARACVTCQAHTNHVATTGQETASRAGPEAERNRGGARHPGCVRRVMQGAVVVTQVLTRSLRPRAGSAGSAPTGALLHAAQPWMRPTDERKRRRMRWTRCAAWGLEATLPQDRHAYIAQLRCACTAVPCDAALTSRPPLRVHAG